jgi:hypothetical protein
MLRLNVLRLSVFLWRHSLSTSRKLSGRSWITLAVVNAVIATVSFWAYQAESVPKSPPVYTHNNLVRLVPETNGVRFTWESSGDPTSAGNPFYIRGLEVVAGEDRQANVLQNSQKVRRMLKGLQMNGVHLHFQRTDLRPDFSKFFNRDQVVLQVSSSESHSLLTPVQQVLAIVGGILAMFVSAVSLFFTWMNYRRNKAQEILWKLQIAKLEAELEEQRAKARKEQAETGIILIS